MIQWLGRISTLRCLDAISRMPTTPVSCCVRSRDPICLPSKTWVRRLTICGLLPRLRCRTSLFEVRLSSETCHIASWCPRSFRQVGSCQWFICSMVEEGQFPRLVKLFGGRSFCGAGAHSRQASGYESYDRNSAERPEGRCEDYIENDLMADVETRFRAAIGRQNRAIVGVSMGGFGAVQLALRHPELFAFVGGLSSAIDVPRRPLSNQANRTTATPSVYCSGPGGRATQRDNDPFLLARAADPSKTPCLFLTCGEQEGLLPANRRLAELLQNRQFKYEFHAVPGGQDWSRWNARLASCSHSLLAHLGAKPSQFVTQSGLRFPHSLLPVSLP